MRCTAKDNTLYAHAGGTSVSKWGNMLSCKRRSIGGKDFFDHMNAYNRCKACGNEKEAEDHLIAMRKFDCRCSS
jgi:hypothetical protein